MATYKPLYRHMADFPMRGYAPGITWQYTKAAHDWPLSPLPRSKHRFGEFTTDTPLTAEQVELLEVERID